MPYPRTSGGASPVGWTSFRKTRAERKLPPIAQHAGDRGRLSQRSGVADHRDGGGRLQRPRRADARLPRLRGRASVSERTSSGSGVRLEIRAGQRLTATRYAPLKLPNIARTNVAGPVHEMGWLDGYETAKAGLIAHDHLERASSTSILPICNSLSDDTTAGSYPSQRTTKSNSGLS